MQKEAQTSGNINGLAHYSNGASNMHKRIIYRVKCWTQCYVMLCFAMLLSAHSLILPKMVVSVLASVLGVEFLAKF